MTNRISKTLAAAMLGAAAACSPAADTVTDETTTGAASSAAVDVPTAPSASYTDWAGKWVGVEGMYVEITPAGSGAYSLKMQSDLDTLGTYAGQDADGGIAFERGGEKLLLKAASGDQTGLKFLAGKPTCLMVASGEGYCRDE